MARKKILSKFGLKNLDATKTKKKVTARKTKNKNKILPIASKTKTQIKQYAHETQKRANNPPVGLVTPDSDKDMPAKKYSHDPHLDPQLEWTGKIENSNFEVDTVSLHRHERIDPMTIIGKVMKNQGLEQQTLFPFFEQSGNNLPLRDAIEFYKHDQNWSNRLIAGDSLLVMNSLLEKEGMGGQLQMIYIDPPYGIKYGSNFQPFVNKKKVKDGKDEDLTQEPETIKAFRDVWELGIHSYLTYLRNRLLLAKDLLTSSGSCFVQISDENIHLVRLVMDEIFTPKNFVSLITVKKTGGLGQKTLDNVSDYVIWYCKDKDSIKYNQLYIEKDFGDNSTSLYNYGEFLNGERKKLTKEEFDLATKQKLDCKLFRPTALVSESGGKNSSFEVEYNGKSYRPINGYWKTNQEGFEQLKKANRLMIVGNRLNYIRYLEDFPAISLTNLWDGLGGAANKIYVVQTNPTIIQRCMLMTTDPGDLVFDPTCGSGTTAFIAEKYGRRWMTCDTSRVTIALTKQRLMTAQYDYYKLKYPEDGISTGFICKEVPHVTLKSIVNNESVKTETLHDKPEIDRSKIRITGPFTVEAVPSPIVKSLDTEYEKDLKIDSSISRITGNMRQQEWRDELLNTGVRGKGGQKMDFSRVETHPATKWIHAIAETKEQKPKNCAVSFGPEYSPLEQRQVTLAITEAQKLIPKPELIIFAALQFDPEAAKDIDELQWPGVRVLKVQVNADLLTTDLKKKRASNESFWLMGQPDAELKKQKDEKYVIEVKGFDYYNTKTGEIESGDSSKIAMWMLDTDYDESSLYPQQVFFPMSSATEGWSKLTKTLKSDIDEELIEHYSGTQSIPFSAGPNKQVAIKIIDDRGIESLRIIKIE